MALRDRLRCCGWEGAIPPAYVFSNREFGGVVLDPPDFSPGSWVGGQSSLMDCESGEFWLTVRQRKAPPSRGFATEIHRSKDGMSYRKMVEISTEDLEAMSGQEVASIEAQQLIRDPTSGKYYFYVSANTRNPREKESKWDTFLLKADDPVGPWSFHGLAWKRGNDYDTHGARGATIGIVDGLYFALYKATSRQRGNLRSNVALATSTNGLDWKKHGVFQLDGIKQPDYLQLYGNIFAGGLGPVFMGFARKYAIAGCGLARDFEACIIDYRNMNLEKILSREWVPLSPFERKDYPSHGYMSIVKDPTRDRLLLYIEAIDPEYTREVGWRTQVDRLIAYETRIGEKFNH